jgi:Beta-propeller repeat
LPAGEFASSFFNTNPIQPYNASNNVNVFLTVLNASANVIMGTTLGGTAANEEEAVANLGTTGNFNPPNIPVFPGQSLFVDPAGNIYIAGSTNAISPGFQDVVQATGSTSQVFINPSGEGAFVAKLGPVAPQSFGNDQFEANDTSDLATNLDAYQANNLGIGITYGPFANLNTYRHKGGPVGDGLNYNGLFDYDWYQIVPTISGSLTVSLTNISVLASGVNGALNTGDLDLYIYTVINGFLYLSGSSTLIGSSFQTASINVTRGADILIDVNPYNYTQASYTMSISL